MMMMMMVSGFNANFKSSLCDQCITEYNFENCLHHQGFPDDVGSTHLWNVGRQSFYTAVQPRRQLWTWVLCNPGSDCISEIHLTENNCFNIHMHAWSCSEQFIPKDYVQQRLKRRPSECTSYDMHSRYSEAWWTLKCLETLPKVCCRNKKERSGFIAFIFRNAHPLHFKKRSWIIR
jgi:hypothetical protein